MKGDVNQQGGHRWAGLRRKSGVAVAVVAVVVVGAQLASAGIHFNDVGITHPFYDEIEAIRGAGITTGYADGTYRPDEPVTRQAMAAFMARGFSRGVHAQGQNNQPPDGTPVSGASAEITAGTATPGTGGFVMGSGSAMLTAPTSSCPCILTARVIHEAGIQSQDRVAVAVDGGGTSYASLALNFYYGIVGGELGGSTTYRLEITVDHANGTGVTVQSEISLIYVPFDGTGDSLP